jgi:hypothetical protein
MSFLSSFFTYERQPMKGIDAFYRDMLFFLLVFCFLFQITCFILQTSSRKYLLCTESNSMESLQGPGTEAKYFLCYPCLPHPHVMVPYPYSKTILAFAEMGGTSFLRKFGKINIYSTLYKECSIKP